MALFVRKLSNILASKLFAVVLISLILTCLSIFPIANASAQTCDWNWDILSISDIKTNYQSGEIISGSISFRLHNAANSSAIQQLLIGIIDSQNKVIDVKCIYNGVPKTCPAWTTGTASFSLKAPVTPGNYKVIAADYFEYSCSDAINKFPSLYSSTSPYCKDITTITISAFSSPPTPENVSAQACGGNWDISSISGIKTNYQPGETISGSISFKLNNPSICPSCTQQVLVGIIDSQNKVIDVKCVYDGIPKVCPLRTTGTASFSLKTPAIPGNYKIIAANYYQDSCSDAINKYLPNQVGSQAALVQYKDIATVTIAEASPAPVPPSQSELEPTPIPNPFEDVVPQIEKSITQIKQKIDLIIQQIWNVIRTIVLTVILPLFILVLILVFVWRFRKSLVKFWRWLDNVFQQPHPQRRDMSLEQYKKWIVNMHWRRF
jgi:hypothetical protein